MDDLGAQLASLDDETLGLVHQFLRTTRGNAREQWVRLCATHGIHFDDTGSARGSEGQTVDMPTPELIEHLEREAVDFDAVKLAGSALSTWREKTVAIDVMKRQADAFYYRNLMRRVLTHWREELKKRRARQRRLERRLQIFNDWKNACVVRACLQRWIIRHRENSMRVFQERQAAFRVLQWWRGKVEETQKMEVQAEDAHDFAAASSVFTIWREKTAESRRVRRFKTFYLTAKYGRALADAFRARKKAREQAELLRRYKGFVTQKDQKLARSVLGTWHAKTMQAREDEITADKHCGRTQDERAQKTAHTALTKMYDQAVDSQENRQIADQHYEKNLINRFNVLGEDGSWRTQVRENQENEARAEEYREIKTEEKALDMLRGMRNQAARTKQMEGAAEEFKERLDKKKALSVFAKWRQMAAEKRGQRIETPAPQTPAAKKSALFK